MLRGKKSRNTVAAVVGVLGLVILFLAFSAPSAVSRPQQTALAASVRGGPHQFLLMATDSYTAYIPLLRLDPTPTPTPTPTPFAFYDTFDNPASGWPTKSFNANDPFPPGPYASGYGKEKLYDGKTLGPNNVFNVKTAAAWNSWIYPAPVVVDDPRHFTVELIGKSAQNFMWASSWGVYFNANPARTQMYTVQIYQDGNPGVIPPNYQVRRWLNFTGAGNAENIVLDNLRRCGRCQATPYEWNRIKVVRDGDMIYVYLGSDGWWKLQATYNAPQFTSSEYVGVGVFSGNFEWSDWQRGDEPTYQVDNFYVSPARYP